MSYEVLEESIESGRPIFGYEFILGNLIWRYTSADQSLMINGFLYEAVAISDDGPSSSGEPESDVLTITAPVTIGPASNFSQVPSGRAMLVNVRTRHEGDTESIIVYSGEVTQINFGNPGIVTVSCITLSATMQRNGLRLGWQRSCPYALYDPATCKVDKSAHALATTITAIALAQGVIAVASVGGAPSPHYSGGIIEWTDVAKGGIERRMIEFQNALDLVIFGPVNDFEVGQAVTLYPGCARTFAACYGFGNILNYGGHTAMPGKSPFDGTPVF